MSSNPQPANPFSPDILSKTADNIYKPILELNKAGGLLLVWIFIGTILLIGALSAALVSSGSMITFFAIGAGGVGALIILVILCLSVVKLRSADSTIKKSKEYLEVVDDLAREMTALAFHLQSLAFKYQEELRQLIPEAYRLGLMLPRMMISSSQSTPATETEQIYTKRLQGLRHQLQELNNRYKQALNQSVKEFLVTTPASPELLNVNRRELLESIARLPEEARKVIEEVKKALISSDPTSLKKPLSDLKELNAKITKLLASDSTWDTVP